MGDRERGQGVVEGKTVMATGFKKCNICGCSKELSSFNKSSKTKDGYDTQCKSCQHDEYTRSTRYIVAREKRERRALLKAQPERQCTKCGVTKPLSDFSLRRSGYHTICKSCKVEYSRQWVERNKERSQHYRAEYRATNREKYKQYFRLHHMAHPEKQRARNQKRKAILRNIKGSFTGEELKSLFARQKGKCAVCKMSIKQKYHIDHVVPISRGGDNYICNIQLLCPSCNLSKHNKDSICFMQTRGFLC